VKLKFMNFSTDSCYFFRLGGKVG